MANDLIFMTGATGVLGRELVREILRTTDATVAVLVRAKDGQSRAERVAKLLACVGAEDCPNSRIRVIEGDVTQPRLGIPETDLKVLQSGCTVFYHIAALTALNGTEADCQAINVGGTEHALEIAWDLRQKGKLERFVYFSTAYVAGSMRPYRSLEDELPAHPAFANHYESSKYQAEQKVRGAMAKGLPTTILRPSIVVGHSKTGEVSEFNVIYPLIKLFAHGVFSKMPTRPESTFNVVPWDFVIQATCAIVASPKTLGKTYHLVSPTPPTIGMLLQLHSELYPESPRIEVLQPEQFDPSKLSRREQLIYATMGPYLSYLNGHLSFDTTNAAAILREAGISLPITDYDFLKIMVGYAVKAGYLSL